MRPQMRCASGADLIGKHAHPANQNSRPREGSVIREVYDLFMENRGKAVAIRFTTFDKTRTVIPPGPPAYQSTILAQLRDIYGLEIVRVAKNRWMLVGEWYPNNIYLDYSNGTHKP